MRVILAQDTQPDRRDVNRCEWKHTNLGMDTGTDEKPGDITQTENPPTKFARSNLKLQVKKKQRRNLRKILTLANVKQRTDRKVDDKDRKADDTEKTMEKGNI